MFTPCKNGPMPSTAVGLGAVLLASAALALTAVSGPAMAGAYNSDAPPSEQIGQVCQSTLGVSPGEAHYAGCVESLSQSRRAFAHSQALARARDDCLDRGLSPNSPSLAECTLAATETGRAAAAADTGGGVHARSYFSASPSQVHRREEAACAHLGIDPSSGGFATCVAGLQTSRFMADNPLN
jgi:hypothetical protein